MQIRPQENERPHAARASRPRRVRFADFEFDLTTLELFRGREAVALPPKPSRVLALLLERGGSLVDRSELQANLWPDTFVEFDQSLNTCVRQLRKVLGDDAETPRFIETVPRRGYRFIGETRRAADLPTDRYSWSGWLVAVAILTTVALLGWLLNRPRPALGLAVLPLEMIGGTEQDALFAEGLTEELIATLGRADPQRLRVLARSSSYRIRDLPLSDLHDRFDIDLVLQGRVRVDSGAYKMSLQIVRAESAISEWSVEYRQPLAAPSVTSQETLAYRVSRALDDGYRIGLLRSPEESPPSRHAVEWRIALRLVEESDETSRRQALEIVERIVAAAPEFAAGWVTLARLQIDLGAFSDAEGSIARAIEAFGLTPGLALERGRLSMRTWRLREAGPDLELAASGLPQSARAQQARGYYLAVMGRHEWARRSIAQARALDPASSSVLGDAGLYAYWAGDAGEAIEQCRLAHRYALPRYRLMVDRCLLHNLVAVGDLQGALAEARIVLEASGASHEGVDTVLSGGSPEERLVGYFGWAAGDDALEYSQGGRDAYRRALALSGARRVDEALDALELAYRQRLPRLIEIGVEPRLDPLREEDRFQVIARHVGLGSFEGIHLR